MTDQLSILTQEVTKLSGKVGELGAGVTHLKDEVAWLGVRDDAFLKQLTYQNELLAVHIKGVEIQAGRLDEERRFRLTQERLVETRLAALEAGPTFWRTLRSHIVQVITLFATAGGLLVLFWDRLH